MADTTIEFVAESAAERERTWGVPPPLPPDDPEAWYAPDVEAQYEVSPGVVATITRRGGAFHYRVREPTLTKGDQLY